MNPVNLHRQVARLLGCKLKPLLSTLKPRRGFHDLSPGLSVRKRSFLTFCGSKPGEVHLIRTQKTPLASQKRYTCEAGGMRATHAPGHDKHLSHSKNSPSVILYPLSSRLAPPFRAVSTVGAAAPRPSMPLFCVQRSTFDVQRLPVTFAPATFNPHRSPCRAPMINAPARNVAAYRPGASRSSGVPSGTTHPGSPTSVSTRRPLSPLDSAIQISEPTR